MLYLSTEENMCISNKDATRIVLYALAILIISFMLQLIKYAKIMQTKKQNFSMVRISEIKRMAQDRKKLSIWAETTPHYCEIWGEEKLELFLIFEHC